MTKSWITPLAALAAALAVVLAPLAHAQTKTETKSDLTAATFAQKALESGEKEAALSKLAGEKASSADIKQFAQMLAQGHTQVNEQLRLIAQGDKAMPPKTGTTPSSPGQRSDSASPPVGVSPGAAPAQSPEYQKLNGLSGPAFDKAYLDTMIEGHEKSVALYEQASTSLDGAAKKLATETLPKIKDHLQQAKNLRASLKD